MTGRLRDRPECGDFGLGFGPGRDGARLSGFGRKSDLNRKETGLEIFRGFAGHAEGRSEPVLGTSGLLGFEPQLLSYRLSVKVRMLRADLIALNLSEGRPRVGDGTTGRRGPVH